MEILTTTLGQMAVLFILIIIGFLLAKLKTVPNNTAIILSKLENTLFVPALILSTFTSNFKREKLCVAWKLFLFSFVICFIMMALAILVAKGCSKDRYIRNVYTSGLAFSNFAYMGNAVVSAVFPDMFMDYMIFAMPLYVMLYFWAVPCLLISSDREKQTLKSRLKTLANPMFVALIVGIGIGLLDFTVPQTLTKVISALGACMSPIAMLLIGITAGSMNLKKVISLKSIYVVSFVRLLIFPLLFIGIFALIPMSHTMMVCTICTLAMPLGLAAVVVPSGYGKDTTIATGMAIVSHLFSVLTIPIIFYLMTVILL